MPAKFEVIENMFSVCNQNFIMVFQLNSGCVWSNSEESSTSSGLETLGKINLSHLILTKAIIIVLFYYEYYFQKIDALLVKN